MADYYILENGEKLGPFTEEELLDRPLEPTDMVQSTPLGEYEPAYSLSEFREYFKSEGIYYPTPDNTNSYLLRLPAYIIDILILIVAFSIVGNLFFGPQLAEFSKVFTPSILGDSKKMAVLYDQYWGTMMIIHAVAFVIIIFYNAILEAGALQGSIGKYAMGIVVVDEFGYRVTFGQALKRNFGKIIYEVATQVVSIFAYIFYLRMIWSELHQAIHDRFAGCYIVKKNR